MRTQFTGNLKRKLEQKFSLKRFFWNKNVKSYINKFYIKLRSFNGTKTFKCCKNLFENYRFRYLKDLKNSDYTLNRYTLHFFLIQKFYFFRLFKFHANVIVSFFCSNNRQLVFLFKFEKKNFSPSFSQLRWNMKFVEFFVKFSFWDWLTCNLLLLNSFHFPPLELQGIKLSVQKFFGCVRIFWG